MNTSSLNTSFLEIQKILQSSKAHLVAVSKKQKSDAIQILYNLGHKVFGENYVQELMKKKDELPSDIQWHFIGHLQTNKVKYIASFIHSIHTIDSVKLIKELEKQLQKHSRKVEIFIQVNISNESSKSGIPLKYFDETFNAIYTASLDCKYIILVGLMGMTSWIAENKAKEKEFIVLKELFDKIKKKINLQTFQYLSMGMSDDYVLALKHGATHLRIGTKLFGQRM